jgi:hypothetical protein
MVDVFFVSLDREFVAFVEKIRRPAQRNSGSFYASQILCGRDFQSMTAIAVGRERDIACGRVKRVN